MYTNLPEVLCAHFLSANYVGVLAEHITKHCGSFTVHIKKSKYIISYAEEVSSMWKPSLFFIWLLLHCWYISGRANELYGSAAAELQSLFN
jgi:hypothetical protein